MRFPVTVPGLAIFIFYLIPAGIFSQPSYAFNLLTTSEECFKGTAILSLNGTGDSDTVQIEWSNGRQNILQLKNLDAGDYSVRVNIRHWQDSATLFITDTVLPFSITRDLCPVGIPKYFSPNGDGYNDDLKIANIDKHPEFELGVYNKWGQKVHGQKKSYIPWDGTWNGIPLPDGAYYYVFFFNAANKDQLVKGDITILR